MNVRSLNVLLIVALTSMLLVSGCQPLEMPPENVVSVDAIMAFDAAADELPEGVAVDDAGNTYVSMRFLGQVWRITPDGDVSTVATFPDSVVGGLMFDTNGDLFVAVGSEDQEMNGVMRIASDGSLTHISGSEAMPFPNAITFDEDGTLYVTDSIEGSVWRAPADGGAERWIEHESLHGDESLGFGIPIGANGIAYYDQTIYVANSEKHQVVAIPILEDGFAGQPQVVVPTEELVFDGIVMAEDGLIYALAIAQSQLLRMNPIDGSVAVLASYDDGLDWPASLTFGRGDNANTLSIVNLAIGPEGGMGPALLKADVGEPGYVNH